MTRIPVTDRGVRTVVSMLETGGHRARLVGGAVRDLVAGQKPKDMDVATDALPDAVMEFAAAAGLRTIPTGLQHGTLTVVVAGIPYEVTTLRRDVETDGRHASVAFVSDFREDAARRDFTFNAMSADMDGFVHDYFGGVSDLAARRVRFVGSASERIAEDYLRILRFFRFRARFGGGEAVQEFAPLQAGAAGLRGISVERVWSEMSRIMVHPSGMAQVEAMQSLGIADVIGLPWSPEAARTAGAAAAAGARPGTVLGVLCGSGEAAAEVAARWKLSRSETEDARAAAEVLADGRSARNHWLGIAADGMDPTRLAPVLVATGRLDAAEALKGAIPVFPLRGRDLSEAGVQPGPGMGAMLAEARAAWKESGFAASADELLATLLGQQAGRRP